MNMPGFTGEASLYKTMARYHAVASAVPAFEGGRSVAPQLPRRSIGFCMAGCDGQYEWGTLDNTACKFDCMSGFGQS
jgi:hypothetical protein